MKRRALGRLLAVAAALTIGAASPRASAWDPSTTHLGITDRAAVQSALHLRWMAGSELGRGLFSDLQIDPARLRPEEWRLIMQTIQHTHASAGVQPLGGPGACPGADAPPETTRYCVRGDRCSAGVAWWS